MSTPPSPPAIDSLFQEFFPALEETQAAAPELVQAGEPVAEAARPSTPSPSKAR